VLKGLGRLMMASGLDKLVMEGPIESVQESDFRTLVPRPRAALNSTRFSELVMSGSLVCFELCDHDLTEASRALVTTT